MTVLPNQSSTRWAEPAHPGDQRRFDLELERVRLRAQLAVALSASPGDAATVERVRGELAASEAELAPLRATGGRADALSRRLALTDDELELLWAAVAATVDPRLQPHLQVLAGSDARRGIALSTWALLAGLDSVRARALSSALLGRHPLFHHRLLLVATEGQTGAARALAAAPRLCAWLAGSDGPDEGMQGAGAVVTLPAARHIDDAQRVTGERLARVLASPERPLVVLEGPVASGRRTAVAVAAPEQRPVVALDVRR